MDRHTVSGLQAVRRIADRLGLSEKVYGPLYELFEVDERFQTAVEVICGGSLFHVVVEDDATVTRILDVMNKERAGRVTFMPLNRLKPREGVDQDSLGKGVIPMLRKLKYDEHLHKAFVQVLLLVFHMWCSILTLCFPKLGFR